MCVWSDITAVQDCDMHYMNAWLKRCVFNLDLNRESVSEPRTLSGSLFQSLGARYEKVLPPLVDFAILGTTKSPEFCDLRERVGLLCERRLVRYAGAIPFRASNNILKLIQYLICCQCRDCKIGVIWSYFLDLVRTLATAFCTICSVFIEDAGQPPSSALQ